MFKNNLANSSIQVTMDIYSHLFPGGGQEWVHKFGDLLTPNAPQAHPDTSGVRDRIHKLGGEVLDSEGKDLVPPIRIERTTRGLGISFRGLLKSLKIWAIPPSFNPRAHFVVI